MKKLTPNQKMWLDQANNIFERIQRLHKNNIPIDDIKTPVKPKVITRKHLSELGEIEKQLINKEKLLEEPHKARVKNVELDYLKSGSKKDRSKTSVNTPIPSRLPRIQIDIYIMIKNNIKTAGSSTIGSSMLNDFFDLLVEEYGENETARIFIEAANAGYTLTPDILYDSDGSKATPFISHIIEFIRDEDYDIFKEAIRDIFEHYDTLEFVNEV